jgi:PAS domain S-box-containing protein
MKNIMTRLASISIKAQLLILAFTVAIPAAGIIVHYGLQTREAAVNEALLETKRLAGNIAAEQHNLISATQQLMIALAQLPEIKKQDKNRVEPILRNILKLNAQYTNILIADRKGVLWVTAAPSQPPRIVSDRWYFKKVIASGQLSSGEFIISRTRSQPTFSIAYPLKNEGGAIVGAIIVGFLLDSFKDLLERAELPAGANFALIDHKGIVLYQAVCAVEFIGKPFDPELFKQMQEGPDIYTYSNSMEISGEKRFVSYRKLRLPGEKEPYMYVRAEIPFTSVLDDSNKALIRNLSIFMSFLVLAVLCAWFIGKRSIADRITLLKTASRNLAKGDLRVRVSDFVVGGELGSLGQTFDEMAQKLLLREQALAESERNYRNIFNATKDAIFVYDAKSGDIIEINKSAEELFGYSREDIQKRQKNVISAEPPYSSLDRLNWIRKACEEGPQQFEWQSRRRNGELFWTEVALSATHNEETGRVLAVVRDITDRKQAEKILHEYGVRLIKQEEELRAKLAAELHDNIAQDLASLGMSLTLIICTLPPEAKEKVASQIVSSQNMLASVVKVTRNIMTELRPPLIDDYGLSSALKWYIEAYAKRSGIRVSFRFDGSFPRLSQNLEITLFRICQEALANIHKHANCKNVEITLKKDDHNVFLSVSDDGVGFELESVPTGAGWGLTIIRERAESIGGILGVQSAPGSGTIISVRVPALL